MREPEDRLAYWGVFIGIGLVVGTVLGLLALAFLIF